METRSIKVVTVVGARPQFIKAAVVSRAIRAHNQANPGIPGAAIEETIIHTGQHFDDNMSDVFFREMDIPAPAHHLGLGGGTHGEMTGRMLEAVERILLDLRPDWTLVYGDTNSTLAGALAAAKLHIKVAHVEAGLRSFNRRMPEEINRVLTDHAADLLFAPTDAAVANLRNEGIPNERIARVGDVMYDAMIFYRELAKKRSTIINALKLNGEGRSAGGDERRGDAGGEGSVGGGFVLATIHRAENTDNRQRLAGIVEGLAGLAKDLPVVLPLHPRTRKALTEAGLHQQASAALRLVEPVGYLDMVMLESSASLIATDSGGVQKEAYFNRVPCITLRDETEWVELVQAGANTLVGSDPRKIIASGRKALKGKQSKVAADALYGDGRAGEAIVDTLRASAIV